MKIIHFLFGAILLLFLIESSTYSQSRTSPEFVKILNKSEKITKAIGWCKNQDTGEWIENENCIFERDDGFWSDRTENFIWIQTWELKYEDIKYYGVLSEIKSGWYTYESIERGWNSEKITKWIILSEKEYKEFKSEVYALHSGSRFLASEIHGELSDYNSHLGGSYSYTEENILKLITTSIKEGEKGFQVYKFNSQNVEGKDVVRFRLQTQYSEAYYIQIDIQNQYFELLLSEFIKVLL